MTANETAFRSIRQAANAFYRQTDKQPADILSEQLGITSDEAIRVYQQLRAGGDMVNETLRNPMKAAEVKLRFGDSLKISTASLDKKREQTKLFITMLNLLTPLASGMDQADRLRLNALTEKANAEGFEVTDEASAAIAALFSQYGAQVLNFFTLDRALASGRLLRVAANGEPFEVEKLIERNARYYDMVLIAAFIEAGKASEEPVNPSAFGAIVAGEMHKNNAYRMYFKNQIDMPRLKERIKEIGQAVLDALRAVFKFASDLYSEASLVLIIMIVVTLLFDFGFFTALLVGLSVDYLVHDLLAPDYDTIMDRVYKGAVAGFNKVVLAVKNDLIPFVKDLLGKLCHILGIDPDTVKTTVGATLGKVGKAVGAKETETADDEDLDYDPDLANDFADA